MPPKKPLLEEIDFARKPGGGRIRDTAQSQRKSGGKRFAILRTSKIKTPGNMAASLSHTFRERNTPNADTKKLRDNSVLIGPDNTQEVLDAWQDRAPEKIRKNAVHGIEYLVTGSPDAMKEMSRAEQDDYFADAISWLEERHGKENILSAVIHRDETTPHLTAMVIPLVDGKLNTKHFLGGRQKMREMQSRFAEDVAEAHSLERGLEHSPATHQRVSRHYAAIQVAPEDHISLPERRKGVLMGVGAEKDHEWRQRASEAVSEVVWEHRMAAHHAKEEAQAAKTLHQSANDVADHYAREIETQKEKNAALAQALEKSQQAVAQYQARDKFLELSAERAGVSDKLEVAGQKIRQERQQREKERIAEVSRKIDAERLDKIRAVALDVGTAIIEKRHLYHVFKGNRGKEMNFLEGISAQIGPKAVKQLSEGNPNALEKVTRDPQMQRAVAHAYFDLSNKYLHSKDREVTMDRDTVKIGQANYRDFGPSRSHGLEL